MNIDKIINYVFWIRTSLLTIILFCLFQTDFFNQLAPNSPIHTTSKFSILGSAFFIIWLAAKFASKVVGNLWDRITPIKDKATIIESEITYFLSVLLGLNLMAPIFFQTGLKDTPIIFTVLFLAALPVSICSYIFLRSHSETIFAADKEIAAINDEDHEYLDPHKFDASCLNIIAYFSASVIFAVSLLSTLVLIMLLGSSFHSTFFMYVLPSSALLVTIFTFFGYFMLPASMWIKSLLKLQNQPTRLNLAVTWALCIMGITTVSLISCSNFNPQLSWEALLSQWNMVAAYLIFAFCAFISGLVLKSFYKAKPIDSVFA